MKTLRFNGKEVKSITTTNNAKEVEHTNTLLINGHVIHGISKSDCLDEFESNRDQYEDNGRFNSVEWFVTI